MYKSESVNKPCKVCLFHLFYGGLEAGTQVCVQCNKTKNNILS